MATATTKKPSTRVTGSQFFEMVGLKVGLKKKVVRDTVFALVDTVVDQLKKNKEVRVPHLGKMIVKDIPKKSFPAGEYVNRFKKNTDGSPLVEHREARVRPASKKLKFFVSSQVKKPVLNK